ncbi:MAG: rhodanese-like domain-containing protein [Promethearchaeota archaeon]
MKFELINSPGIAHNSYFFADKGEAFVVDPRRDANIYFELAEEACANIIYIFETHRNEDYTIGSLELQNLTGAEIAHSRQTPFKYGEHSVKDGDTFSISRFRVEALHTPGHTNDSICYTVTDTASSKRPFMVFTGDTLFVGDIGRTDLPGLDIWKEMTEKQFQSLHEKLLPLGDDIFIYPSHGAGSICGHAISDRNFSTIGYERHTNPALQLDKDAFIEHIISIKLRRPPYFRKMEDYNLNGPPLLQNAPVPRALTVPEFEKAMEKSNTIVVDTRNPDAFAASHLAGSLSIWLNGLSYYPGWVLTYDQEILLVLERTEDIEKAKPFLWRLGYDNITGYLCPGIDAWRNKGKPTDQIGAITATQLKEKLEKNELLLIDVRETYECEAGFVDGSKYIYVGELANHVDELPRNTPLATTCGWGGRGSLAASILRKAGFSEVSNTLGGLNAWNALGYLLVKDLCIE